MKKDEIVKNLKNVKLVIGNGFDLYCGLKTSYRDFFNRDPDKNNYFSTWLNDFVPKVRSFMNVHNPKRLEKWKDFECFEFTNLWDFYFILISANEKKKIATWDWCDIESKIEESLSDCKNTKGKKEILWKDVYEIIKNGSKENSCVKTLLLASIAFKINDCKAFKSVEDFYLFLLKELKKFEIEFSNYVWSLHADTEGYYKQEERDFERNSEILIERLCNIDSLTSIDSFNYDWVGYERCKKLTHNINGNIRDPIFGIDSDVFNSGDARFMFSKTARRMELDMVSDESSEKNKFENIVVFGSSLSRADYSYYFSIFDKISIVDLTIDSKVVFAFSIYDSNRKASILSQLRKNISNLFQEYSIYKGNESHPNRLLDALTTQGKVIMYEIPPVR